MSRSDLSFALLVEEALVRVAASRRQLCVELLCVAATVLRRNPELTLAQPLHLDRLLDDAHHTYVKVPAHALSPHSVPLVELLCVAATVLRRNPELTLLDAHTSGVHTV
jgi:hypothetical protein